MKYKTIIELGSIATIALASLAAFRFVVAAGQVGLAAALTGRGYSANSGDGFLFTQDAAAIIPSNTPASDGFSMYARRIDVSQPPTLGDQAPLAYGQAIAT